jgi:beta-phosphoglucomutase-like phosphatase (HAD superfamily)
MGLAGPPELHAQAGFLAGHDVSKLKPDPLIYQTAAKQLGVQPDECIVVEDSMVGLQAALGAGMACIITYTHSTRDQAFTGATRVVPDLGAMTIQELQAIQAGPQPVAA